MNQDNHDNPPFKEDADQLQDGIHEHDNPLPGWWLITFYGTIIFSFLYMIHFHLGGGPDLDTQLSEKMTAIENTQRSKNAASAEIVWADILKDAERLRAGSSVYQTTCSQCHGVDGLGGIGPNLSDEEWVYGSSPNQVYAVLEEGVLAKGMPSWKGLGQKTLIDLTAFVLSLSSNPVKN